MSEPFTKQKEVDMENAIKSSQPLQMNVGAPHIKSKIKQARNNNYTLNTILPELIDFPIQNTDNICIDVTMNGDNLYTLCISDDVSNGFENIKSENEDNPFNWGHIRSGHDCNDEFSEFGTGTKQSIVACGGKATIYTRLSDGSMSRMIFDFDVMSNIPDAIDSYSPTTYESITYEVYRDHHPFDTGSTILVEKIRPEIYHSTTEGEITENIKRIIIKSYNKILKRQGLQIKVNGCLVNPHQEYFDMPECIPFNIERCIIIKKENNRPILIEKTSISKYRIYNIHSGRFKCISRSVYNNNYSRLPDYYNNGYLDNNGTMMLLKGTGIMFINDVDISKLPKGATEIYKLNRHHGSYNDMNSNGAKNYVYIELHLKSKALGKDLGATYKKTIDLDKTNDITKQLKLNIKHLSSLLEYDTSTSKAERHYNTAIDNGIFVPNDKIPTSLRNNNKTSREVITEVDTEVDTNDNTEVDTNDDTEVDTNDNTEVDTDDNTEVDTDDDTEVDTDDDTEVDTDDDTEVDTNDDINNRINSIKTRSDVFNVISHIINSMDTYKKRQIISSTVEVDSNVISYIKHINQIIHNV